MIPSRISSNKTRMYNNSKPICQSKYIKNEQNLNINNGRVTNVNKNLIRFGNVPNFSVLGSLCMYMCVGLT